MVIAAVSVGCPSRTLSRKPERQAVPRHVVPRHVVPPRVEAESGYVLSNLFDLGHRGVKSFVFSRSSGELFVSFSDRSDLTLSRHGDCLYQWNVATSKRVHTYRLDRKWRVDEVFASPTGKHLVIRMYLSDSGASHWAKYILVDTARRIVVKRDLKIYDERHVTVRWSPDGKHFRIWASPKKRWAFDLRGKPVSAGTAVFSPPPKSQLSVVANSKATLKTHGLYYTDGHGTRHRVTTNAWHNNFALTRDGKYVVFTNWEGELLIWSTRLKRAVHRKKIAAHYGHLAYDPSRNRFLIGDAKRNGTTQLRSLEIGRRK